MQEGLTVAASGERATGFESWLVAREPGLHRLARLLVDDEHLAQDLVQATLTRMFLAWDRLHDRGALDGYARTVLLNELRKAWRRPWRRREHPTDVVPEVAVDDHHDDGRRDVVWAFVRSLPPRQRAVIVLRYYEQLSEAEIADVLAIAPGTVKSQASRALAALRARLDPEEVR